MSATPVFPSPAIRWNPDWRHSLQHDSDGRWFDPAGQQLIQLYPGNNLRTPALRLQLHQRAGEEAQRRGVRRPPGSQFLQQRFHLCPLQLRSGQFVRSGRLQPNRAPDSQKPRLLGARRTSPTMGATWPFPKPTFSPATPSIRSAEASIGFSTSSSPYGYGTCEGNPIGIVNANLDPTCNPGGQFRGW